MKNFSNFYMETGSGILFIFSCLQQVDRSKEWSISIIDGFIMFGNGDVYAFIDDDIIEYLKTTFDKKEISFDFANVLPDQYRIRITNSVKLSRENIIDMISIYRSHKDRIDQRIIENQVEEEIIE